MLTTMQAVILEPLHYKKGISHSRHFLEQARILIILLRFFPFKIFEGEKSSQYCYLYNTSKTLTFFLNRIWLIFVSNEFYNGQGDLPTHKTKQNLSDCWFQRNKYVHYVTHLTWVWTKCTIKNVLFFSGPVCPQNVILIFIRILQYHQLKYNMSIHQSYWNNCHRNILIFQLNGHLLSKPAPQT